MDTNQKFQTKQIIYFIRHGTAQHNVIEINPIDGSHIHPDKYDPKYTDSKLLPRGYAQAQEAGNVLRSALKILNDNRPLDGIFSSPLTRCLETTKGVVEGGSNSKNMPGHFDSSATGTHTKTNASNLQWIVREELREACGIHYSDKRSSKSLLESLWPHVNFESISEEDQIWKPDKREGWGDLERRIDYFLQWISWHYHQKCNEREYQNSPGSGAVPSFLVTTHGVWLECLFQKYHPHLMEGGKRVHNCDLFRAILHCEWERNERSDDWKCMSIQLVHVDQIHGRKQI